MNALLHTHLELIIATFAALFPIMNPFGNAAIFHSLTQGTPPAERHRIAQRASLYAVIILLVFYFGGALLMEFFGISIAGIRIAGGLVITRYGFAQLNPQPADTHSAVEHAEASAKDDIAFSPMALPLMAGPGAIAAVMTLGTSSSNVGWEHHLVPAVAICVVGLLCWLILRYSDVIMDHLGVTGTRALTKIMSFLLLCMGVQLIISGVQSLHLL